jgi:hypothetical protein
MVPVVWEAGCVSVRALWRREKSFAFAIIKPRLLGRPAHILAAVPTEISRFAFRICNFCVVLRYGVEYLGARGSVVG